MWMVLGIKGCWGIRDQTGDEWGKGFSSDVENLVE